MRKFLLVVAIATMGLMTGCGLTTNLTENRNVVQTNIDLGQKNYRIIGTVEGSAQAAYILGIGGLSSKAVQANSHAEMIKNANLTGSQAIINTSTENKQRGFAPFYWKKVVTTYGQVIEFTE